VVLLAYVVPVKACHEDRMVVKIRTRLEKNDMRISPALAYGMCPDMSVLSYSDALLTLSGLKSTE
jgi:hypothetical protein